MAVAAVMVLGEEERKIYREKQHLQEKQVLGWGEQSTLRKCNHWIKPAVMDPKTHPFPSHPTAAP